MPTVFKTQPCKPNVYFNLAFIRAQHLIKKIWYLPQLSDMNSNHKNILYIPHVSQDKNISVAATQHMTLGTSVFCLDSL